MLETVTDISTLPLLPLGPSQLISKLTAPLAAAGITLFFTSTYQSDLLLVWPPSM